MATKRAWSFCNSRCMCLEHPLRMESLSSSRLPVHTVCEHSEVLMVARGKVVTRESPYPVNIFQSSLQGKEAFFQSSFLISHASAPDFTFFANSYIPASIFTQFAHELIHSSQSQIFTQLNLFTANVHHGALNMSLLFWWLKKIVCVKKCQVCTQPSQKGENAYNKFGEHLMWCLEGQGPKLHVSLMSHSVLGSAPAPTMICLHEGG